MVAHIRVNQVTDKKVKIGASKTMGALTPELYRKAVNAAQSYDWEELKVAEDSDVNKEDLLVSKKSFYVQGTEFDCKRFICKKTKVEAYREENSQVMYTMDGKLLELTSEEYNVKTIIE